MQNILDMLHNIFTSLQHRQQQTTHSQDEILGVISIEVWSKYSSYLVRFEVLTAVSMKMAVFWAVAPCSLVEVYRRFTGASCLHHQGCLHYHRPVGGGSKHL
jgi:hypothetical protein